MFSLCIARLQAKPNPIDGALRLHAAGRSVRWGEYFLYSLEKFCICAEYGHSIHHLMTGSAWYNPSL